MIETSQDEDESKIAGVEVDEGKEENEEKSESSEVLVEPISSAGRLTTPSDAPSPMPVAGPEHDDKAKDKEEEDDDSIHLDDVLKKEQEDVHLVPVKGGDDSIQLNDVLKNDQEEVKQVPVGIPVRKVSTGEAKGPPKEIIQRDKKDGSSTQSTAFIPDDSTLHGSTSQSGFQGSAHSALQDSNSSSVTHATASSSVAAERRRLWKIRRSTNPGNSEDTDSAPQTESTDVTTRRSPHIQRHGLRRSGGQQGEVTAGTNSQQQANAAAARTAKYGLGRESLASSGVGAFRAITVRQPSGQTVDTMPPSQPASSEPEIPFQQRQGTTAQDYSGNGGQPMLDAAVASNSDLVHAVLVNDDSSNSDPPAQGSRSGQASTSTVEFLLQHHDLVKWYCIIMCCCFIVLSGIIAVTLVAVTLGSGGEDAPVSNNGDASAPGTPSTTEVPPSSWEVSTMSASERYFVSTNDLRLAIQAAQAANDDPSAPVFLHYGYPMGDWDVSRLTQFKQLFYYGDDVGYSGLAYDLNGWDTSRVTSLEWAFRGTKFSSQTIRDNTDMVKMIATWNVEKVVHMAGTFWDSNFDGNIRAWNVSRVRDTHDMFYRSAFNQDISQWKFNSLMDARWMFKQNADFNQDVSEWKLTQLEKGKEMFVSAVSFNQDLCKWADFVSPEADLENIFFDTSCPSYESPLFTNDGVNNISNGRFCHVCN